MTEDDIRRAVICGPDPKKHLNTIHEFAEAGFGHVFIHQVGAEQKGFVDFYRSKILPELPATTSNGRDMH